jgi:hypothetical protein
MGEAAIHDSDALAAPLAAMAPMAALIIRAFMSGTSLETINCGNNQLNRRSNQGAQQKR